MAEEGRSRTIIRGQQNPRKYSSHRKAKTWERDRRKRMNTYFKTLADLLPPEEEGRKRNKVDILIHASKHIKDLHNRTDELLSAHASEAHMEELAKLKKLVTQLFSRTQLLTTLLREAGISVPAEPALEKISPLKWSNKINVEDAEKIFKKPEEKKNSPKKRGKSAEFKVPSKKKSITPSQSSNKKITADDNISKTGSKSIENQENRVNCVNNKNADSEIGKSESGSKDTERASGNANSSPEISTSRAPKKNVRQIVQSQKKIKRKVRKKVEKKVTSNCINNSVTNLAANTLILSGGKLMPLVTPITSNIIVNAQQQQANPIILSNTQPNQMIVMQPLTNRVQNSVVSLCNQALINTVQKVTLNTVPNIRANMVVDSQNWASNVKNIINATKIGGHKGILPKGKEVTETTMTYKVPIPAVHKEKVERSKDNSGKKDAEKTKVNKSHAKNSKNLTSSAVTDEKTEKEKHVKKVDNVNSVHKGSLKRVGNSENGSLEEPSEKKRKINESTENSVQASVSSKSTNFAATCKSIANLKHVIQKIGDEGASDEQEKNASLNKNETTTETNPEISAPLVNNTTNHETGIDSSKSLEMLNSDQCEAKALSVSIISEPVSLVNFAEEHIKSPNALIPSPPPTDFNVNQTIKECSNNADNVNNKSSLLESEETDKSEDSKKIKEVCNLGTQFDSLLRVTAKGPETVEGSTNLDSNKIILNLDTNTTTTLKPESTSVAETSDVTTSPPTLLPVNVVEDESKKSSKDEASKSLNYNTENSFVPINNRADGLHSDLSNDIFASLQVPSSSHNPESISPTAAFLMAFPLVSSLNGKTEVLDEEMKEDFKYHSQTPPMLLQIGAMEPNSFKLKTASPSHSIAEKRLKQSCEDKKGNGDQTCEEVHSDIIVPVEHAPTTKALPKVVNDETLREPYKIVQAVLTPALEKSVVSSSSFSRSPLYSIADVSSTTSVSTNTATTENCQMSVTLDSAKIVTSQVDVTTSSSMNKNNCSTEVTTCDTNVQYSASQDFLPSYSTVEDNNLRSLQQNSTVFTNTENTTERNPGDLTHNVTSHSSQATLVSHLSNAVTTTNSPSISMSSLQMEYPHMKKDTQGSQQVSYLVHNKGSLESNIAHNNRLNYTGHIDRVLSTPSQSIRHDYAMQSKDTSLPILSSQGIQSVYDAQSKDSHVLTTPHSSQQSYSVHEKDHIVQNSHNEYNVGQGKGLSQRKDPMPYASGNANSSAHNQNYPPKDSISNNTEHHFQRNYPKLNKDSDTTGNNVVDQGIKLSNILRSKSQEQDHRSDPNYTSTKKMDVDPFVQTFSYGVKESISTQAEQNVLSQNTENIFQGKREDTQNYGSYSKEVKKISTSVANSMASKPLIQNASLPRYSQQPTSFVATSNYEQSTITENHAKSTTTVAHNSSNFSILSWTTFSPVGGGGNNNLVHFDQGPNQNDNNEGKTICENYNYVPLHKENPSFSNVLTNDAYSVNSTVAGIDKSRMKSRMETQKQPFVDPSKNRNIQTNVPTQNKQNRIQNQTSSGNNDYKFSADSKSKSKYGMDSDYIQNGYTEIDQQSQQQQQHGPKAHQTMTTKQDKTVYPMPSYDPQVNFDLPEASSQMKYSVDTYSSSNFKYTDKTQQQTQNKYQALVQSQVPTLQHGPVTYNNDNGKHNQQQNSTKPKGSQQQHAIRPPVNWMMTPEIKHNSNIADIILPPIGKELEFCQNNLFAQTPSYNQGTPNQFYNNYDVAAHGFPNLPVLQSESKRATDVFYSEEQPFPWSPTKTSVHIDQNQPIKGIDHQIVPSTLPTLVGDLDLGTNIPEKQNFLFGQVPSRIPPEQAKDAIKDKEGNIGGRDYHAVLNTQNVQHPGAGSSFLSVSQLVEHEKAEKSQQQHQQHHQHHHHHHHPHQHQQQQQQQPQPPQTRKHQRKSNTSPRGNSKRQMDIRKQTSTNDQLHQRHEEQKSSGHSFNDQGYQQQQQQQQKYQQNNVHWRSRNCKSNYTAEALIGTNTSVHDTNHQDKQASIKFAANYTQNKFQSGLSTAETVMPINYFSNTDDGSGYGQMVNQNFNSYAYSSNTNIYPTTNFITSISNTPSSYMMPLHDNTDYMETNTFLLPNVAVSSASTSSATSTTPTSTSNVSVNANTKNHQQYGKHQNCDKRTYSANSKKGKRKGLDGTMQNLEFPLSGINSPLEDYHHSTTFLPPPPPPHASPLYQNHTQSNVYTKAVNGLPPPPPVAGPQGVPSVATPGFPMNPNMPRGGIVSSNPMSMNHHPSGTSLTNFNLSTIFPEMNDKITGYKPPNGVPSGLPQPSNQSAAYAQRTNYSTNSLCHLPQVSEGSQFGNVPPPPPPGVIHYKNV